MERIRTIKNTDYTVINNTCLKDKRLTLKAKGFFSLIMSLPDTWDFSINGMVAISKEGKTAIYAAISELIESGYCVRTYLYENGKRVGVDYTFQETPNGKLNLENLILENQPQLSKDLNKRNNIYSGSLEEKTSFTKSKKEIKEEETPANVRNIYKTDGTLDGARKEAILKLLVSHRAVINTTLLSSHYKQLTLEQVFEVWYNPLGANTDFKDDNHIRNSITAFIRNAKPQPIVPTTPEPRRQPSAAVLEKNRLNQIMRDNSFKS